MPYSEYENLEVLIKIDDVSIRIFGKNIELSIGDEKVTMSADDWHHLGKEYQAPYPEGFWS